MIRRGQQRISPLKKKSLREEPGGGSSFMPERR